MKPKPLYRLLFVLVVAVGSLYVLQGAKGVSAENIGSQNKPEKICNLCTKQQEVEATNNEFIFFESVSKYLYIPLVR